jgi:hypothetical protein
MIFWGRVEGRLTYKALAHAKTEAPKAPKN